MILSCPLCQTRYLIAASVFVAGARNVRCVRCSHSWAAEAPKHIDPVASPPDVTPAPDTVVPIPSGSNLPVVFKKPLSPEMRYIIKAGIVTVVALILLLIFMFDRRDIADRWPFMEGFYDKIGLHIYYYGEGLTFVKVRSELVYDGGIMKLVIDGKVRNTTEKVQEIPNITATAIGADGQPIQSWQIDAPAIRVFPKENVPFHSSINAPKGTVTDINLRFIETKDDSQ